MRMIPSILVACGGFLVAILWIDLMFDVQVLRHRGRGTELPEPVLASIAGYYRRVTTTARPMGHVVGLVMAVLLASLAIQITTGPDPRGPALVSLLLCGGPIVLAVGRIRPNAVRLAARKDPPLRQSALARSICREHLLCLAGMLGFVALHLCAVGR
jgi:hypothetical protein